MLAEKDTRRHRRKNAAALRVGLEESERLVMQRVVAAKRAARLAREQTRVVCRMARVINSSSSSSDIGTTDDDAPPAANAYAEDNHHSRDPKGKPPARKW